MKTNRKTQATIMVERCMRELAKLPDYPRTIPPVRKIVMGGCIVYRVPLSTWQRGK